MNGFIPYKIGGDEMTALEHKLTAASGTYHIGELLYFSSGKLTKASGTTKPEYICMQEKVLASDDILVCTVVRPDILYQTTNSAALNGIAVGNKVTVSSDGMQVTATTNSGIAEIVEFDAEAASATGKRVVVKLA